MRRLADAPAHDPAGMVGRCLCLEMPRFAGSHGVLLRGPHASAARLTCLLIKSGSQQNVAERDPFKLPVCSMWPLQPHLHGGTSTDKSDNRRLCALNRNAAAKRAHTFPAETVKRCFTNFEIPAKETNLDVAKYINFPRLPTKWLPLSPTFPRTSSGRLSVSLSKTLFVFLARIGKKKIVAKTIEENGLNEHLWHRQQQQLPPQDRCCLKWRYPAVSRPP